jgi:hypothetical protein
MEATIPVPVWRNWGKSRKNSVRKSGLMITVQRLLPLHFDRCCCRVDAETLEPICWIGLFPLIQGNGWRALNIILIREMCVAFAQPTAAGNAADPISEWKITKKLAEGWMIYLWAYASCLFLVSFDLVRALNTPHHVYLGSRLGEGLAASIIPTAAVIPVAEWTTFHAIHSSTVFAYCLQPS